MSELDSAQVLNILHSRLPDTLLKCYGLSAAQTTNVSNIGDILPQLIAFEGDRFFSAGNIRVARELSDAGVKVHMYHFDRGNPFPGPLHGRPHHAVDVEYMFGTFLEAFPDKKDVDLSKGIMRFWIEFANGKDPWKDYQSGNALHITPGAEFNVIAREQIESRRWEAYAEMEKNWIQLKEAAELIHMAKRA